MYPYYPSESVTDFDLTPDDILGAQAIYGKILQTSLGLKFSINFT